MSRSTLLEFSAFDTLFFREARPMEAQGVKPLSSIFPPPARTVAGAVRSLYGEAMGVNWSVWRQSSDRTAHADLDALIGKPDAQPPGPLHLNGPFPTLQGQRLFPAPAHLLRSGPAHEPEFVFLKPGPPVRCDLGNVQLPVLSRPLQGAKPLESTWLDRKDFSRVLNGHAPLHLWRTYGDLTTSEMRLGIAIDGQRRAAEDGMLYQTQHVRLHADVGLGVAVRHEDGRRLPELGHRVIRLGGEGRQAGVSTLNSEVSAPWPEIPGGPCGTSGVAARRVAGVVLILLTAARFQHPNAQAPGWVLPGFTSEVREGVRVWRGLLAGQNLTLVSAVLGKAVREGGWDIARHAPRPVDSMLPAGSVFFCTCDDPKGVIAALSGSQIGEEQALGRGELAVGYWFE